MGRIPQEIIDQVLDRTDIVEVVSDRIQVKKAGRSFKACCPFHNEKTPSFIVSPEKQIFHCFGCGAGGNAIGFVMKYENMEFPEAVRILAAKAGVDIPRYEQRDAERDSIAARLYEINRLAAAFYQNALRSEGGRKALEYLKGRGMNSDAMNEFRVGYAPDEWEALRRYCEKKNVPPDLLRKAGLTIPSTKGKGDYDKFRNRIMFPIFNERGNIVAFGGRVLDDSQPKYMNSPETPIYNKSNVLYGLNSGKKSIREKGRAVIVEGYTDVIMPFQYGVTNLVAASGTALTSGQVRLLKKYSDTAVMVFDADQAGEAASLRGLDILLESGMNVKIAALPEGEDPDSYVRKNGKEGFEQALDNAKGLFEYKLDLLIEKLGERDIGGIADEMLPTISRINNAVVQSDHIRRLAERLGVHEASLRYEMGKVKPDYSYHYESEVKIDGDPRNYRSSEIHLLGLAISDRKMFKRLSEELGLGMFRDIKVSRVLGVVGDCYREDSGSINPGKLISRLEGDEGAKAAVVQALAKLDITKDREKALNDCMTCVRREARDEKLKELSVRLKKAQDKNDDPEIRSILEKINRIHKEKVI